MPAYYRATLSEFVDADPTGVGSVLTSKYAADGYFQLLSTQSVSWEISLPMLQKSLRKVSCLVPDAGNWGVLLEYPLYRLRRRIDLVVIAGDLLFVVELKVGADRAELADINQVEEYALDLRDFHKASHGLKMQPVLCCTELPEQADGPEYEPDTQVQRVVVASAEGLASVLTGRYLSASQEPRQQLDVEAWDSSSYEPVPTIIEAATTIFAGHSVKSISRSDAENLAECSQEVLRLIEEAKTEGRRRLIVVTGVPGSGKTLAGLNVAHGGLNAESERGEVVYLSGNTPLVLVIREALAQDEKARCDIQGERKTLKSIRHDLQTRIQHINDFLKEYCRHDRRRPPHEHAIVFDEAQRAWDRKQGQKKFGRNATEPELLLEVMGRHTPDWAAIVCLVGAGQEINTGEAGMRQWGEALSSGLDWELVAPDAAIRGAGDTAGTALFPDDFPSELPITTNNRLRLTVPMRSYRSEFVSVWVDAVLSGDPDRAAQVAAQLGAYPITLTRSLQACRGWLKQNTRGQRRAGLLASSKASRLLAEGLGASLTVEDKNRICHWYLKPIGDYRSSNSLEVTANEYTCQGLELDFAGICWGGDFMRANDDRNWSFRKLRSTSWNRVHNKNDRRFILNKYRVFLTRAREGMVLFVPHGDLADNTRPPMHYDKLAEYLVSCGAQPLAC